ncbi:MAG: hypothetical protein NTX56_17050 [Proteobacteria bacterium]|nr:hypothetical protein [Pseudomonadota bacterium]
MNSITGNTSILNDAAMANISVTGHSFCVVDPMKFADILLCKNSEGVDVVKITHKGEVFWLGREVTTDNEFRAAMLDLRDSLMLYFGGRR